MSRNLFRKKQKTPRSLECLATLSPEQPQFARFVRDSRLAGIRMNNIALSKEELVRTLRSPDFTGATVPLFADAKGRQIRITEVLEYPNHLELVINHSIEAQTPVPVLFKAGTDDALLERIEDDGRRLVFRGGPRYKVREGESLHVRHPSLRVHHPIFTSLEKEKLEIIKRAGITRFFLSYVEERRDIDEFLEIVGKDAEVWLKIETERGLRFVAKDWKKQSNLTLVAARGDLYVEIEQPHLITEALKLIIEKDSDACVGSRILLSLTDTPVPTDLLLDALKLVNTKPEECIKRLQIIFATMKAGSPVPSCSDLMDIAWLYEHGYRRFLLCDNLYLKKEWLETALNILGTLHSSHL